MKTRVLEKLKLRNIYILLTNWIDNEKISVCIFRRVPVTNCRKGRNIHRTNFLERRREMSTGRRPGNSRSANDISISDNSTNWPCNDYEPPVKLLQGMFLTYFCLYFTRIFLGVYCEHLGSIWKFRPDALRAQSRTLSLIDRFLSSNYFVIRDRKGFYCITY